ncbi:MAG: DeoR/GlpR transcriptional regulator [Clostridiales bacterium]|nr:DeoR/GlpR transcriptional regulator [Clostridiales bacterium]
MLYTERAEFIMQQLQLQSTVKVTELSQLLHISVDTVRRDLKTMEQQGLIKYIHGGACLPDTLAPFLNFNGREIINIELKREAACKALSFIKEGDVVALNSGTTNTVLSQELALLEKEITVITNNYAAINILLQNSFIHLIVIGGEMDALERSTYGTTCENEFRRFYPDIAFLSINAVDYSEGFTDFRFKEMGIIQLLAKNADKVIAVMDSGKLGKCSKKQVLRLDQVDILAMDNGISEEIRKKYEEHGIVII